MDDSFRLKIDALLNLVSPTDEDRLDAVGRLVERCMVLENYTESQPEEYTYCGCSDPGCPCEGVKSGPFDSGICIG
jgi:hypothetical protein